MTATTLPRPKSIPAAPGKVRVGPVASVAFEDRHTLGLRMQELARFAQKTGADVGRQLKWYRRLIPEPGRWPAAVWLGRPGSRVTPDVAPLRSAVAAGRIQLFSSAGHIVPAVHLPHRNTDRFVGLIGWIEFRYDRAFDAAYSARSLRWHLQIDADGYSHQSELLVRSGNGFAPAG